MSVRECVQCLASTKSGSQCKNVTCKYSEFCRIHTHQLFDLTLKKSTIPGAGSGLVTLVSIPPKTRIAKYTGEVKSLAEYKENPSGYAVSLPKKRVLDAASTQSGIARYSNDCRAANKRAGSCNGSNAKFKISTRAGVTSVWLVSTKHIPAKAEIFVSYGRGFWKK